MNGQPSKLSGGAHRSVMLRTNRGYLDGRGKYGSKNNARLFDLNDNDDTAHAIRIAINDGAMFEGSFDSPYRPSKVCIGVGQVVNPKDAKRGVK